MAQGKERHRALSGRGHRLGRELERSRVSLEETKQRAAMAGAKGRELRLSEARAGLLAEELEAVRGDCGRLVQLVRYKDEAKCSLRVRVLVYTLPCTYSVFFALLPA